MGLVSGFAWVVERGSASISDCDWSRVRVATEATASARNEPTVANEEEVERDARVVASRSPAARTGNHSVQGRAVVVNIYVVLVLSCLSNPTSRCASTSGTGACEVKGPACTAHISHRSMFYRILISPRVRYYDLHGYHRMAQYGAPLIK